MIIQYLIYLLLIVLLITLLSSIFHKPESKLEEIALINGSPVYRFRIDATAVDKIYTEVENYYKRTGLAPSEKEGWNAEHLSNAFYENDDMELPTLTKEMSKPLEELCHKHSISPKRLSTLNDYWVNVYRPGDYQGSHCHINQGDKTPFYCFTYFSKYSHGLDAPLRFHPRFAEMENSFTPEVHVGDVLLFPQTLEHSVQGQKRSGPRITVSGNIYHEDFM